MLAIDHGNLFQVFDNVRIIELFGEVFRTASLRNLS
jgi:hypothetical protein